MQLDKQHNLYLKWKEDISDTQCWSLSIVACSSLRCHKQGLVTMGTWETELTKDFKTDSSIVEASKMDLQLTESCNRYRLP